MTEKLYEGGLTGKQRFDRVPEHGWDASIDIRQGRKWLRERGDTVRQVFAGVSYASDTNPPPTVEDVERILREDLSPYVIYLRRFGIRPRTVVKMLKEHFRGRIGIEPFTVGFLKRLAQYVYVENNGVPGIDSMAGDNVPDGMAWKTNREGKPLNIPENIGIAFVRLGVSLRYDAFADRYYIDGLSDFGPLLEDAAMNRIRFDISRKYGFLPSREMTFDYCYDFARYYRFDPVLDYFERVEEKWDGVPRLDRFLIDYAGAADTPYVRAVSELMFLSVVRRNRQPGAKFDEMIVLESAQGKNKSEALRIMARKDDWFGDSFPMDADERKTLEHGQGKLIIEVAELQGIRRTEVESVKAMLSRRIDEGRLAYARSHTKQPRRFIFIGTSNGDTYLQDDTGNRRFWPVKVQAFDLAKLRRDIDQLWGEAAGRESLGFPIRLDQSLWAAAGEQQAARLAATVDPFADTFRAFLGDKAGRITSEDAWAILGIDPGRRTPELNRRFGAALRAIGWKRCTVKLEAGRNGKRVAGYGAGKDARLLVVTRDHAKRAVVDYEEAVSDGRADDWPEMPSDQEPESV